MVMCTADLSTVPGISGQSSSSTALRNESCHSHPYSGSGDGVGLTYELSVKPPGVMNAQNVLG